MEDRPTKRNFKNFTQSQHTKDQQANITYAQACMHNNIAKPYDKFLI